MKNKFLLLIVLLIYSLNSIGQCLNDLSYSSSYWGVSSFSPVRDYPDRVELDYKLDGFDLNAGGIGATKIKYVGAFNLQEQLGVLANNNNFDRVQLRNCYGQYEGGGDSMVLTNGEIGCKAQAMASGTNLVDIFTYVYPLQLIVPGSNPARYEVRTWPPTGMGGVINDVPPGSPAFLNGQIYTKINGGLLTKNAGYEIAYVDNHPGWQATSKHSDNTTNPFNAITLLKHTYRTHPCNSISCVYAGSIRCTIVFYKACNLPAPSNLNNLPLQAPTAQLISWSNVTSNNGYEVQIAPVSQNYGLAFTGGNYTTTTAPNSTSLSPGGLLTGTQYKWRIRTKCLDGTFGPWSADQTFTTPAQCTKPNQIVITNIGPASARLSWTAMPNAAGYEVQWAPNTNFSSTVVQSPRGQRFTGTNIMGPSQNWTLLDNIGVCTNTFYRVRTICQNGTRSDWSQGSFSTAGTFKVTKYVFLKPNGAPVGLLGQNPTLTAGHVDVGFGITGVNSSTNSISTVYYYGGIPNGSGLPIISPGGNTGGWYNVQGNNEADMLSEMYNTQGHLKYKKTKSNYNISCSQLQDLIDFLNSAPTRGYHLATNNCLNFTNDALWKSGMNPILPPLQPNPLTAPLWMPNVWFAALLPTENWSGDIGLNSNRIAQQLQPTKDVVAEMQVVKTKPSTFPNPFTTELNIKFTASGSKDAYFEVFDHLQGKKMYNSKAQKLKQGSFVQETVDTASWAAGMYIVKTYNGNGESSTQKVIKQ